MIIIKETVSVPERRLFSSFLQTPADTSGAQFQTPADSWIPKFQTPADSWIPKFQTPADSFSRLLPVL
ncbi:hypothetical protein [Deinococcus hopiensis]|uniref:hypothetical protein n=1 Tax=Deinococcus hopiensis TaxID=309885 RepID=UPI00111C5CE2|nr:hypothetical protein [Deinococcus hopiensis]